MTMAHKNKGFINYYNLYKDKIFNYFLYRIDFNVDLAEDLTSEVFIKALKSFENFDENKNFQSWIFTIAKNHLINHYHSDKKIIALEDVEDNLRSPETDKGQFFEIKRVMSAIKSFTQNQQELLLMRYIDELSYKEISEILGKEEGAIRTQISRNLTKLREILN